MQMVLKLNDNIHMIEKFNDNFLKMKSLNDELDCESASLFFLLEIAGCKPYYLDISVFITSDEFTNSYMIEHKLMSINVSVILMRIHQFLLEGKTYDLVTILTHANLLTPDGISLGEGDLPNPVFKVIE